MVLTCFELVLSMSDIRLCQSIEYIYFFVVDIFSKHLLDKVKV